MKSLVSEGPVPVTAESEISAVRRATVVWDVSPAGPARSGFTLVELLVAMSLIIFIMSILAEAFSGGLHAFRNLKGIGDLDERLRTEVVTLRRAVEVTDRQAAEFIEDSLRTETVDREEAADLKEQYEAICASVVEIEVRLREFEQSVKNPGGRRILRRSLDVLVQLKLSAATMVELLRLLESGDVGP